MFRRSVKAKIVKHYITGNDNLLNTVQRTAPLIIIFKINNRHGFGRNHSVFGKNCDEVKAVNTITGSPRPPLLLLVNPPLNFRSDQADNRGGPTTKQNITGQSFSGQASGLFCSSHHRKGNVQFNTDRITSEQAGTEFLVNDSLWILY